MFGQASTQIYTIWWRAARTSPDFERFKKRAVDLPPSRKSGYVLGHSPVPVGKADTMEKLTLKELSGLATGGKWIPGHLSNPDHSCNCRYILADCFMGSLFEASVPCKDYPDEYPTDKESGYNLRLVCELVNLYRQGHLVESTAVLTSTDQKRDT